jgi:autotransporter-associated beta strand protein
LPSCGVKPLFFFKLIRMTFTLHGHCSTNGLSTFTKRFYALALAMVLNFKKIRGYKMKRFLKYISLIALVAMMGITAQAQTTKTSTGTGSWSTAGTWSPSGVPAGNDNVVIASGHTVTLTANVTTTGNLTLTGTIALAGFNLTAGSLAGAGNIGTASGTPTVTVGSNGSSTTYSGVLSGTGTILTKTGTGTLALSGANTYTGVTNVNAGILNIQNNTALGTTAGGTVVAAGAKLQLQNGITVTGEALTLNGIVAATAATGGTVTDITVSGINYRVHTFTSTGSSNFVVTNGGNVEYLVVAGGGGGGTSAYSSGGGGAGGYRSSVSGESSGGGSAAESPLTVTSQSYTVTVGAGGAAGGSGSNSSFGVITATGGGAGVSGNSAGFTGGSGGGGGGRSSSGGSGTTGQGSAGGSGDSGDWAGNGGGGAGGAGGKFTNSGTDAAGGAGGAGITSSINGTATARAGGGGGGDYDTNGGGGAVVAGGGKGGQGSTAPVAGAANTGGGGGGRGDGGSGAAGGSGIVIVRYVNDNITEALENVSGNNTWTGTVTLAADNTINTTSGTLSVSGVTSGAYALTKTGTGSLTLSGTNTYTGVTNVNAGILNIQNNAALGSTAGGTVVAAGAKLQLQNNITVTGEALTLNGKVAATGGTVVDYTQNGVTYRVHTFTSSGTLNVTSGSTVDVLVVAGGGAGGTYGGGGGAGGVIKQSTTLTTGSKTVTVGSGGNGTDGGESSFNGLAAGGGGGGGNVDVKGRAGVNATTVGGSAGGSGRGTAYSAASAGTPAGNNSTTFSNASGANPSSGWMSGSGGGGAGAVGYDGASDLNEHTGTAAEGGIGITSDITGSSQYYGGGGGGTWQNGSDRPDGGLGGGGKGSTTTDNTLSSGTANTGGGGGGGWTGSPGGNGGSGIVIVRYSISEALENVSGNNTWTGTVTLAADNTINTTSGTLTVSGVTSGAYALTKTGTSTLTLTGTNTYTGATTISAGTLQIGDGGTTGRPGTANVEIQSGATFAVNRSNRISTEFEGLPTFSGAGIVVQRGTGTLALRNNNSGLTGGIRIEQGTLDFGNNPVNIGSGTITLGVNGGTGNVVLLPTDNSAQSFPNPIVLASGHTGSITIEMIGEGPVDGAAGNSKTFTGGITGTNNLTIKQSAANEELFFTTGSINFTGTLTHEGGTGLSTISSVIGSNVTSLTQSSSGKLILSGANTYSGATTISAGTLQLGASGVIPDGSALTVASGATFNLAGFSETVGSLAGAGTVSSTAAGTPTLTAGGNNTSTTFSGVIQNGSATSVALTKTGSGTLALSGAHTYTGATTVSAGTLALTGSGAIGASAVTVSGGTFAPGGTSVGDGINVLGSTLTIGSGGTVHFDLAEPSSVADDQIQVTGAITLGGTLTVNNLTGFGAGTYRLMTCSGTPTGSFATINLPAGFAGSVRVGPGFVDLAFTVALPVTWLDFTGEQVKGVVRLDWQTASEQNSSHFEIERSANGGEYTRIGRLNAAGNSDNIRSYAFMDETAPTGVLLYRLLQVDIDGRFSYSKVVRIRITAPSEAKIGPNPTNGAITLQIPAEWKSNVEWRLYTIHGHLLEQRTKMGSGNYTLDLSKRSAGTYQLTLYRNGELVQKEWIIRQ